MKGAHSPFWPLNPLTEPCAALTDMLTSSDPIATNHRDQARREAVVALMMRADSPTGCGQGKGWNQEYRPRRRSPSRVVPAARWEFAKRAQTAVGRPLLAAWHAWDTSTRADDHAPRLSRVELC